MTVPAQLVDARNWAQFKPILIQKVSSGKLIGLDCETEDTNAHEGLKEYRKSRKGQIFDMNRIVICGLSLYQDGDDVAYYINTHHADIENRIPVHEVIEVLEALPENSSFICHNAPFEITVFAKAWGVKLERVVCTLQMAVSAYGPDDYPVDKLLASGLGDIAKLFPKAAKAFATFDPEKGEMDAAQAEVFNQVVAKESDAAHSWNGLVKSLSYGYGLKQAVKSHFGYQMQTYEETLAGREHMGQLTGEEVVSYGADDAYWCVRLFHHLLLFMQQTNPKIIDTFFRQENPMIHVYSQIWQNGLRVNEEAIYERRQQERQTTAKVLRQLKADIRKMLPFPDEPHESLYRRDDWYTKKWETYRKRIASWAMLPDCESDYDQCLQVSGAVSNAWLADNGGRGKLSGPNFTHYMIMRTVLYDLLRQKLFVEKGKTQSDGEARGRLAERIKKQLRELVEGIAFDKDDEPILPEGVQATPEVDWLLTSLRVIKGINELAGIEQRMKLYLTPYTKLTDPETGRMYPTVSSKLATRRMASANPNGMQLAKRGESTYIRGFYEPDNDEHRVVSIDWSQIELVLIGEFSGDPEFARCYSQIPYLDLHLGAAADALTVVIPEMSEELLNNLHNMSEEEILTINERILTNINGVRMSPAKAKKYWRTEVGKGSNFNYWYSGALSTVGQRLGWTSDQMWEATDRYRNRFAVAEQWRVNTIEEGRLNGFVELPDGHRRNRFEATYTFQRMMGQFFEQFGNEGLMNFGREMTKALFRRAGNQLVNAKIQGSCATLAKRSILRVEEEIKGQGFDARFMMPIHDELVWSVNKREIVPFIKMAKQVMCDHPEIVSNLKIDATAAVGVTFEPFTDKRPERCQIELDEAPKLECLPPETEGGRLNDDQIQAVVDWLDFKHRQMKEAA